MREKHLGDAALHALCRAARSLFQGLLLVSGRPDIAVDVAADGVHLPAAGLPVTSVRRRFPQLLVGVSTHSAEEITAARDHGAHYATFGPVFPTPGKMAFGPAQGLDRLAAVTALGLPILAVGGIEPDRVAAVLAAGASGVAGIRCFADRAATSRMLVAFDQASARSRR